MKASRFIQTSAVGALAAALAFTAVPASARPGHDNDDAAQPQQEQHRGGGWQARQQAQAQPQAAQPQQQVQREQFQAQRQQWQAQRTQWQQARPQVQDQQARQQWQQQRSQWQGQRNAWQGRQQQDAQRVQQVERQQQWQQQAQRQQQYQVQQERNRTYSDQNRTRDYGAYRGQTYGGARTYGTQGNAYRYQSQGYRGGTTQWNRTWRNDNRYDWQRYRASNRNVFRLGRYYSPYQNYSYRRFGIGSVLDRLFYGENYWIADPWQYRLPDVYGPYRWVRYYDDALLVDVYSGEVVDVIYDFFW